MTSRIASGLPRTARILAKSQLLAGVASLLVVGGILMSYQFITLRRTLQSEVAIHAEVLAENISAPLMFGDRDAANEVLHAFLADPVLVEAIVRDQQGQEFAAFRRKVGRPGKMAQLLPNWFGPVTMVHPVVYRGRTLGSTTLSAGTGAIDASLQNYGALFALSSFAALLASALLSRRSRVRVARAEAGLAYLAYTDAVTGLPNRRGSMDELEAALANALLNDSRVGLVMIDLDNFKVVNDSAGHAAGDELLRGVGMRLRAAARGSDVVGRFGGDEFIAIVWPVESDCQLRDLTSSIIGALRLPIVLDTMAVTVLASVGTCIFPDNAGSAEELLRNADIALYHAKGHGRNRISEFQPSMMHATQRRAQLERDLRRAIDEEGFTVAYQPQFDCRSGEMVGVEALLRWMHPEHGPISPDEFIPLSEECGLIVEIGKWVLERACRDVLVLQKTCGIVLQVAVNVSARQFRETDFVHDVEQILSSTGLAATRLELELTEGMLMNDRCGAIEFMQAMRALGVRLSIDDFGTGYSSLAYLQTFPINQLKIDRRFVQPLPGSGEILASAVIGLAHGFGLTVVAEGVEEPAQLEWLQRAGCEYAQGYLLGRPMPLQNLQALVLTKNNATSRGGPLSLLRLSED